ncbi:SAM-dependent methyltransferase [Sphaerimonospora cavernae]|uniref:SAM-dependent methyltransferase n=1 Tax=Sphaerimonospora cavernae TaxID=1740611 RepID=A0ABV6U1A3_9ACTN
MPTQDNVHQVAQRANPASRVVSVDNDPVALVHARALLARDRAMCRAVDHSSRMERTTAGVSARSWRTASAPASRSVAAS